MARSKPRTAQNPKASEAKELEPPEPQTEKDDSKATNSEPAGKGGSASSNNVEPDKPASSSARASTKASGKRPRSSRSSTRRSGPPGAGPSSNTPAPTGPIRNQSQEESMERHMGKVYSMRVNIENLAAGADAIITIDDQHSVWAIGDSLIGIKMTPAPNVSSVGLSALEVNRQKILVRITDDASFVNLTVAVKTKGSRVSGRVDLPTQTSATIESTYASSTLLAGTWSILLHED